MEIEKTLFHGEADWALTQIAQEGDGISILRDTEKLSEHSPGQLAVEGPALPLVLDQVTSFIPFPASAILWFCESLNQWGRNLTGPFPL